MTLGVDLSPLFADVCSVANLTPEELRLKKMLYIYTNYYASKKPELALLTVNILTKDCGDQDPTVRALALRSLCSLRVENLVEHLVRMAAMHYGKPRG
jgi:vesicle coat complex subunit